MYLVRLLVDFLGRGLLARLVGLFYTQLYLGLLCMIQCVYVSSTSIDRLFCRILLARRPGLFYNQLYWGLLCMVQCVFVSSTSIGRLFRSQFAGTTAWIILHFED